jgi:hypothetical protein
MIFSKPSIGGVQLPRRKLRLKKKVGIWNESVINMILIAHIEIMLIFAKYWKLQDPRHWKSRQKQNTAIILRHHVQTLKMLLRYYSTRSFRNPCLFASKFSSWNCCLLVWAHNASWTQKNAIIMNRIRSFSLQIIHFPLIYSLMLKLFINHHHQTCWSNQLWWHQWHAMSRTDSQLLLDHLIRKRIDSSVAEHPADHKPLGTTMVYKYEIRLIS